jgi:two-component system nitrate/nitrite response regulator NarL
MDDNSLRILIIADDPLARTGLATLLAGQPSCLVAGQIGRDIELLPALDTYRPDLLLWDLGWEPDPTLPDVAEFSDLQLPSVALLPDDTHALDAWDAGLRNLLFRDIGPDRLTAALQAVVQELVVIEPQLLPFLQPDHPSDLPPLREPLTPREQEVLQLLAEGLPNKAIARHLDISDHTVKFHVNAIMGKLGAQSRTEAVVRATRLGLLLL